MKSLLALFPAEGRGTLDYAAALWWRLALAVWAGWVTALGCLAAG